LNSISIYFDRPVLKGIYNEIGDDATIIGVHVGPIGVENPGNLDAKLVLAMVIKEQGFSASFTLVITGSNTDTIDIAAIIFPLRVDFGIAIDFRSRRLVIRTCFFTEGVWRNCSCESRKKAAQYMVVSCF